jgi:cytidyltransferase-like protein
MKTVLVTGSFDLLHSGHVTFLKQAAKYGKVVVGIGSDYSIEKYKGHKPIYNEDERLFMLRSLRGVIGVFINSGEGPLDFIDDLQQRKPDIHICNEDQDSEERRSICQELGIEYIVLKRNTIEGLPVRSTTNLIELCKSQ